MRNRNRHQEQEDKPRFTVLRVLTAALIVLALAIGIGLVQNHYNDPLRGCRQFKTFTEYKGYTCDNGAIRYVPPQK